jgi:hypothetical protein
MACVERHRYPRQLIRLGNAMPGSYDPGHPVTEESGSAGERGGGGSVNFEEFAP